MGVVTNQLSNQSIVTLAKQNYEKEQRSKVPGYRVELPSLGKVYPETSPLRAGFVELRHMTSYDEDILSNSSYINDGTVLERLVDGLLLTPGVSSTDFISGDFNTLIIVSRIHGYGPQYPVTVTDPKTGILLEREIDLSTIQFKPFDLVSDASGEFEYTVQLTGHKLTYKYLTFNDTKSVDPERVVSSFMQHAICSVNGNRDKTVIENYIKYELPAGESKKFRNYVLETIPGLNFDIEFEGEDKDTFTSRFPIGPEILWA